MINFSRFRGQQLCMVILIGLLPLFQSCTKQSNLQVAQYQFDYPVLKNKDFNHVLQLIVNPADTLNEIEINEIVLNTEGTTRLEDIERVAIYYTGKNRNNMKAPGELFAETQKISTNIRLKGRLKISGPEHCLWVSYTLKPDADVLHFAGCSCSEFRTNKGKTQLQPLVEPKKLRFGFAVRKAGDDKVNTYRIPCLVETNKGSLLAGYDVRREFSRDLQGHIDIGISRSTDGGNTWESMILALDMGEWGGLPQKYNGVSDACLLVDKNSDKIFVAGIWMHGLLDSTGKWIEGLNSESTQWAHQWREKSTQPGFDVRQTSQFIIATSTDDGKTWGEPVNITRMVKKKEWWLLAPAPGNGITMMDGTLVFPSEGRDKNGEAFSCITYSKDGGKTWKTSNPAFHERTTECAVAELPDGSLMLNMRYSANKKKKNNENGRVIAITKDMGQTWTEHPSSRNALREPVCMASLYKHDDLLFFSNPDTEKNRTRITIKCSPDFGNTWPQNKQILLDEGWGFGYSCLNGVGKNHIGILYESSQAHMVFQKIAVETFITN